MSNSHTGVEVSPEQLKGMKSAIHKFLEEANAYNTIRDIVDTYVEGHQGEELTAEYRADIMKLIKERGVLQDLLTQMKGKPPGGPSHSRCSPLEGEHYLHVRLNGGRAFVDNIDLPASSSKGFNLYVAVHFGSQRFESSPKPCVADPDFDDDCVFELDAAGFGFGSADLIEISTPFHVAVFREDTRSNTSELLGENIIDWRKVLKSGFLGLTIELCGRNGGVPAGIVDVQLELLSRKRIRYNEVDIAERVEKQRAAVTNADRDFLVYARRWWSEYQSIRPTHKERKVKLFASTTSGRMVPVTHFVSPLQSVSGIDSPYQAARFVSLLRTASGEEMTSKSLDSDACSWLAPFVFLSQRKGHPCNHATMLCSLLLGFNLDTHCVMGSDHRGSAGVYCIVNSKDLRGAVTTTIWDPATGERYPAHEQRTFATADCIFNHKCFYANCQPFNTLTKVAFDLENEEMWRPLNVLKLRMVPRHPAAPLQVETTDLAQVERSVEVQLRSRLSAHRETFGVQTLFDNNLSYVLAQALILYEQQRCTGRVEDFSLFESSIKGSLGPGKTFKAIPINVSHTDDGSILSTVLASPIGKEIADTVADDVRFGIRAKAFLFPERVMSVWVMLAVSYKVRGSVA